jgi:hypothetical protein
MNQHGCPYRIVDDGALDCWSGNCTLAAQELDDALASPWDVEEAHDMREPSRLRQWWAMLRHRCSR